MQSTSIVLVSIFLLIASSASASECTQARALVDKEFTAFKTTNISMTTELASIRRRIDITKGQNLFSLTEQQNDEKAEARHLFVPKGLTVQTRVVNAPAVTIKGVLYVGLTKNLVSEANRYKSLQGTEFNKNFNAALNAYWTSTMDTRNNYYHAIDTAIDVYEKELKSVFSDGTYSYNFRLASIETHCNANPNEALLSYTKNTLAGIKEKWSSAFKAIAAKKAATEKSALSKFSNSQDKNLAKYTAAKAKAAQTYYRNIMLKAQWYIIEGTIADI